MGWNTIHQLVRHLQFAPINVIIVLFGDHPKESQIKRYVVAAILVVSFAAPALAEEIYVVFDPASHKCEAMHNIPQGMKSMGKYGSMEEAKKAMASMKECG